tara:strand:- start:56 stop:199 length:144 start_codon:yes stop_codon:yes gene_type:complete
LRKLPKNIAKKEESEKQQNRKLTQAANSSSDFVATIATIATRDARQN